MDNKITITVFRNKPKWFIFIKREYVGTITTTPDMIPAIGTTIMCHYRKREHVPMRVTNILYHTQGDGFTMKIAGEIEKAVTMYVDF